MFEYGKDIPLEGVAKVETAQKEGDMQQKEGQVFSFNNREEIPLDSISRQ